MRSKVVIVGAVVAIALAACGDDDSGDDNGATGGDGTPAASVAAECADVDAPEPRPEGGASEPTEPLDADQTWTLTFDTSCGTFLVTLDLESAPATAASLVALAEDGFYDDTLFHRIVPGFVIQGGDPTQTGGGGPGYQTVDVPAPDAAYTHGVVAMAKAGPEPAGMAGSQFFVVTGADVGEVTDGLDVVDLIGTLGDPATEQPTQAVVIDSVTATGS